VREVLIQLVLLGAFWLLRIFDEKEVRTKQNLSEIIVTKTVQNEQKLVETNAPAPPLGSTEQSHPTTINSSGSSNDKKSTGQKFRRVMRRFFRKVENFFTGMHHG